MPRISEPLRTNTRLVVVDVVVTDSKGQPVSDLKAEDFALLEAGKPQTISGFRLSGIGRVFRRGAYCAASAEFTVWAYGKNKEKPDMSESDITKADLKPDVYQQVMKQYFPCFPHPGAQARRLHVKAGRAEPHHQPDRHHRHNSHGAIALNNRARSWGTMVISVSVTA